MMLGVVQKLRSHWPQWAYVGLVLGIVGNAAYLLWPNLSSDMLITPHPATLTAYTKDFPVLVAAPSLETTYALVDTHNVSQSIQPIHVGRRTTVAAHPKKAAFQGIVHLNIATAQQLQQLPGIGPKMAQRILAYRKQLGQFNAVNQLLDVPGIGPKKLEKLLPHCKL